MLHATSGPSGEFEFTGVPLSEDLGYAVMAVYEGATYVSEPKYAREGIASLTFTVPIYETTKDTSQIRVDEVNVMFSFALDGMEISEIYQISNLGDRTIKDAQALPDGKTASLKFTLPQNANYIFFKPDSSDRFLKFPSGFAETYPVIPGIRVDRFLVSYLLPYPNPFTYSYQVAYPTGRVNLVLPAYSGVTLSGRGLSAPKTENTQSGKPVVVYSAEGLQAGDMVKVAFGGNPKLTSTDTNRSVAVAPTQNSPIQSPIFIGGGLLGIVLIGGGLLWWRRSKAAQSVEMADDMNVEEIPDQIH